MSGLDDLAAQRQKVTKRSMPPPKNPARSTPVQLPETTPAVAAEPTLAVAPKKQPPISAAPSEPAKAAGERPGDDDLARYSVYLDATLDDYLTDVLNAGRKRRPKLAVSRSAVVRLALTELASRMNPDGAAAQIAAKAPVSNGTGRKRL